MRASPPAPAATLPPLVPRLLAARLSVFYGWVVLGCLCCAGFARQGPAVATLSIFVAPLTGEFGWSRTALSGAVSLGGLLAAIAAPLIGPLLDRRGSRLVLCMAVLVNGVLLLLLSLTGSFDLGIYGALSNWFVRRRAFATSVATLAQQAGLVAMPLIAQLAILQQGWRTGWLAIGAVTLAVGFVPTWLLLVRRPEDLGLHPDGQRAADGHVATMLATMPVPEPAFSRRQALRTPAFWLLLLYAVLLFPVQAGVSLHQAPYLIERGIDATTAAMIVSTFSLMSAAASVACGVLPRRLPIRYPLAFAGMTMAAGTAAMLGIGSAAQGYLAGAIFGFGIGALLTLLPIAWADYFGRAHFGAIRGIALSAQVLAQAAGPLLSGALRDWSGDYRLSLEGFAALAVASTLAVLLARQPRRDAS